MTDPRPAPDDADGGGDLLLRGVRPWAREPDDEAVDVLVRAGRVARVASPVPPPAGVPVVDCGGGVLVPALADVHAHLDSTRLGLPFRPHTAEPGLAGLVENDRRHWRSAERPVTDRATYTLGRTIASGATRVRSHAQVDTDSGLERLEGVLAAREAHRERAAVEVVAFPQRGILRDRGTAELLEEALRAGADLVGGIDPCALDRDPVRHLDVVFGVAERHGCGVDLHLHETGELGAFTLELVCERVAALSMQGRVTVSHAFALSSVDRDRRTALVDLLGAHDVAVTTVAPGVREPLPLDALRRAGVRVGLGQDGIRDYWSPYGDGDVLGRAWQLAYRSGSRRDEDVETCVEVASLGGAAVLGEQLPGRGVEVGAPADLLVLAADSVTAAVMDRPDARVVVRAGRVVARDGELVGEVGPG
ncbi:amidohydrolase [Thalassiella azotivora]